MNKRFLCVILAALLCAAFSVAAAEQVGDFFTFGHYEQDNDAGNGMEPIEWRILAIEGDEALVISRYALDSKPYNEKGGHASWVRSSLRAWLNEEFYGVAFGGEEKQCIITKEIQNWKEDPTTDAVFLLDNDQAKQMFANHDDRQVKPTAYAIANGAYQSRKYGPDNGQWWLRTKSWENKAHAAYVAASGGVMTCGGNSFGVVTNARLVVRPAMYVSLGAVAQLAAAQ